MVRFKVPGEDSASVESPSLLFRDLPRDESIKFLWGHQEKMLDDYYANHLETPDVALELPTGSGKTLVGLLAAEYARRKHVAAVVFLCPTRQLCKQVDEQAERYGIPTVNLTGSHRNWSQKDVYRFQQGQAIAVATYSTVFNSNPAIQGVDTFVCDDAHAAADYVSGLWTLEISREDHPGLFDGVMGLLAPILPTNVAVAIESAHEQDAVDLVSLIRLHEYMDRLKALMSRFASEDDGLKWAWGEIAAHIDGCCLYCSSRKIEIRPVIPPTDTHQLFKGARQRVYMSATLGEDGDLERAFGRRNISRLPIPEGWETRGTGRRLVMQPGLSIENPRAAAIRIMQHAGRGLWLANSSVAQVRISRELEEAGFAVVGLTNRDGMSDAFARTANPAAMVVACRYDGIDLPGDLCRVAVVEGLPRSLGLQERFLYEKLQAQAELRDRIRTRVVQAFGRCTRDETDYSLVLVVGGSLHNWLAIPANTRGMHPESQAEIQFGASNSLETTEDEFVELCVSFLDERDTRQEVDRGVRALRDRCTKVSDAEAGQLVVAARYEIDYSHLMWRADYAGALAAAVKVLDSLEGGEELRPYRGFWYHAAAVASFLAWKDSGQSQHRDKCIELIRGAKACSHTVTWLSQVEAMLVGTLELESAPAQESAVLVAEVTRFLDKYRLLGSRFDSRVSETRGLLTSSVAKDFERGLKSLGQMLGAQASRPTGSGAPDGLWVFDTFAVVLEAKSDSSPDRAVSIDTVRQTLTHETRVRADSQLGSLPVDTLLLTPQATIDREAAKIAGNIRVLAPADALALLDVAAIALGEIRAVATSTMHDSLASLITSVYSQRGLSAVDLRKRLVNTSLSSLPVA
ncbi:MAG: DEAD/DEAH box helicase [Coriobacteriia bacterium]|nr:DEAD/DEAH box helicase [Coriobacteriia bacterium]